MQRWHNFDIELFDRDLVGAVESVRVRVARSPAGEQRDPVTVEVPACLRPAAQGLAGDGLTLEQSVELGRLLAKVLLPAEILELFERSRVQLGDDDGLRLRIQARTLELADLPWEYLYCEPPAEGAAHSGFLGLDRQLSIVRYEPVARSPGRLAPIGAKPIELALLLANPTIPGGPSLDLEKELALIEAAVADRDGIQLQVHRQAGERALHDALDARPQVFHFSGHGRFTLQPGDRPGVFVSQGELLLESAGGAPAAISADELATKMRGTGVRLAVLNSCETARRDGVNAYTGIAPTLVRDGVPAVVAMQYTIRDRHAQQLARRLYHNLADHQSIDAAVTAARIAMFDADSYDSDWGVPVLYLRSDQAVLFPRRGASAGERLQRLGKRAAINVGLATLLVLTLGVFFLWLIEPRLPFGRALGGVLAVAAAGALMFLRTVAGDRLRNSLLGWFKRPAASAVLGAALAGVVIALIATPPPVALRVVAGKTLISQIASADVEAPLRVFRLTVETDNRAVIATDFRKVGVTLAGSDGLARRLTDRYQKDSRASFDRYLEEQGLQANRDAFLRFWQRQPQARALQRLGHAAEVRLVLEAAASANEQWVVVACQRQALADNITVVFLEQADECNDQAQV